MALADKVLISTNPTEKTAVVRQGLVDQTVVLDPWPSTDVEVEAQAFAAVMDVDKDYSKVYIPDPFRKQATEL